CEHLSFGLSYLIAVVMTVGLISTYMYLMLKSGKVALTIAGLLALIYLVCYVLLNMAVYALLMGSLVLFFALAAMMYASLRIEKR
ncbi:MAG: cell envelope integrity protein CreD, partial [Muribaculaceae bacterium]|nr:cell envelope integrity protein CreD [Muribaculaceae bacterium]